MKVRPRFLIKAESKVKIVNVKKRLVKRIGIDFMLLFCAVEYLSKEQPGVRLSWDIWHEQIHWKTKFKVNNNQNQDATTDLPFDKAHLPLWSIAE